MNILELYELADWIKREVTKIQKQYTNLQGVLQHNATQQQKQPLEDPLQKLNEALEQMPMKVLTSEQIRLLEAFDIADLVSINGARFVQQTIVKSDFDPAQANQDVQAAIGKLKQSLQRADAVFQAFSGLETLLVEPEIGDSVLMRVEFRDQASIRNVVEWKDWAEQWVDISRGISMSFNEAPENVRVVGASRGSIILELAGSYLFVRIMAGIANSIIGVARSILELRHTAEDLRAKKLLTDKLEAELRSSAEEQKANGVETIYSQVVELLPKEPDGEQSTALKRSITKLLNFHEKGGQVDFVEPESEGDDEAEEGEASPIGQEGLANDLRTAIEDYRSRRDEVERLEQLTHNPDEDESSPE